MLRTDGSLAVVGVTRGRSTKNFDNLRRLAADHEASCTQTGIRGCKSERKRVTLNDIPESFSL